ncbi:MAG: response regulator receiver domain [Candidatus Aminicenantes bacterium]|jgi:hypothetical protein
MNFDSAAKEIVSNSIRSAICIDDEFVEPYEMKRGKVKEADQPKQLMESFRKSNCSLDIYTYRSYLKLKEESDFIFKNRDLMILDWELSNIEPEFKYALNILKDAVENPGLAFVLIYTKEPDLAGIEMQIRYYFNEKIVTEDERKEIYNELLSCLNDKFFFVEDSDGVPDQAETFFKEREIKDAFEDFILSEPSDEAIKKFESRIMKYFSNEEIGERFLNLFEESVKELYGRKSLFEGCEQVVFQQVEFFNRRIYLSPKCPSTYDCHKIHGQGHALWVNNTYITIFHKGEPTPDSVYERFSNYLCCRPGNVMTLIALEMKNNFRENSGKVGKNLLAIDEVAFFHHRNNLPNQDEFYDFLRNIWKHQVAYFHLNSDSMVFPVLEEYIRNNQINKAIDKIFKGDIIKIEKLRMEVAKLNYLYSFHHIERKKRDYIRFGDIFTISKSSKSVDTGGYLLNITAHCDCLRPDKINFNFHFVSGKTDLLKTALRNVNSEKYCFSFLFRNHEPVCISWETKPFTIFIPEDNRFFSANKPLKVQIGKESKYLFYEGTLLENYTQRIANISFAHAARVGVDLVELKSKK